MVWMLVEKVVGDIGMIVVEGKRWYVLKRWLEHPSQMTWGGEDQMSSLMWYLG